MFVILTLLRVVKDMTAQCPGLDVAMLIASLTKFYCREQRNVENDPYSASVCVMNREYKLSLLNW